jgi:acetyl-CoA carboxylase carboxyltransferase component
VVGCVRLQGRPVGLLANQPRWLGGVPDADAADKGARFVGLCGRFGLPLAVLVDTPGLLPDGIRPERTLPCLVS